MGITSVLAGYSPRYRMKRKMRRKRRIMWSADPVEIPAPIDADTDGGRYSSWHSGGRQPGNHEKASCTVFHRAFGVASRYTHGKRQLNTGRRGRRRRGDFFPGRPLRRPLLGELGRKMNWGLPVTPGRKMVKNGKEAAGRCCILEIDHPMDEV